MIPKRFSHALDECLIGFFQDSCGCRPTLAEVADIQITSSDCVLASIGFTSDAVKGALTIVARVESLRASHPMVAMGAEVTEADLYDWAGEVSNQTLGRFKNALLPYGLTLNMSIPAVITGTKVRLALKQTGERLLRGAKTDSGLLFGFVLIMAFEQGFDPASIDSMGLVGNDAKKEGDGVLF